MTLSRKLAGAVALAGFLACCAWGAGMVPTTCCSKSCEPCPVTVCKATPAAPSPKTDTAAVVPAAVAPFTLIAAFTLPSVLRPQIPAFPSHEFRRPMRN